MQMVEFLGPAVGLPVDCTSMHVYIHEDNVGALILDDTLPPQYTPRSKHYRCGASLGGAVDYILNPTLRLKKRRVFTFGALIAS